MSDPMHDMMMRKALSPLAKQLRAAIEPRMEILRRAIIDKQWPRAIRTPSTGEEQ